jgi:cation:H+ antiporter
LVSAKAALRGKSEVALGNIFGSNVFNSLVVVGLPGLFTTLPVDEKTFLIGVPTMAIATLLFVISGISKKIYIWEGFFFLSIYVLFIAKLFQWF